MCTAVTYQAAAFYMGRTLDYDCSFGEEVVITPRKFPLPGDYAVIGMAHVADGYPLYYDAVNEKGLGMAGLNFVGNAKYRQPEDGRCNVPQYALLLRVLRQCATLAQARAFLQAVNVTGEPFGQYPAAELHWLLADRTGALAAEPMADGLRLYENPVGVLTNNPPFDRQLPGLSWYMQLSAKPPENRFSSALPLRADSRGMGAVGLPGDWSSQSRFVRAAFARMNSVRGGSDKQCVAQLLHILGTVAQPAGCCELSPGVYEKTIYTACWNADRGDYYYTTYDDPALHVVSLHHEDLDGRNLIRYPLQTQPQIFRHN